MPWIVPFIPLIAAGVGAAGIGTSIYEADKSGDAQKAQQAALLKQQQAQAAQANLTKQEAVLGAQGQAQQQTGGSLTDSGTAALTDLLAGYPGYQSGSSGTSTGAGTTTASGTAPPASIPGNVDSNTSSTDPSSAVTQLLTLLRSGNTGGPGSPGQNTIFGGNWQSQPTQPQSFQELANPPLG